MTETTLCGYCVDLPENRRATAVQVNRCPLCKTELGISAGGARFRIGASPEPHGRTGPWLIGSALALGAIVLAVGTCLALAPEPPPVAVVLPPPPEPIAVAPVAPIEPAQPPPADVAAAKRYAEGVLSPEARAKPQIGPLVPMPSRADVVIAAAPAKASAETPGVRKHTGRVDAALWQKLPSLSTFANAETRVEFDLLTTPEIGLAPITPRRPSDPKDHVAQWQKERQAVRQQLQELEKKIHAKNAEAPDGFIRVLAQDQPELAGLPFRLGKACRLSSGDAAVLGRTSRTVRGALTPRQSASGGPPVAGHPMFWLDVSRGSPRLSGIVSPIDRLPVSLLPALMQILPPAPHELRVELIARYRDLPDVEVTHTLVQLALFDPAPTVRDTALKALKPRPAAESTEALLDALRHPWPPIAERAASAIVVLERKDLAVRLVRALGAADPRDPFEQVIDGKKVAVVREMVKVNHHRNCLLCHAPLTPAEAADRSQFRLLPLGAVPSPAEELPPSTSIAYYGGRRGETLVRADVTYLRQDFSLMLPVEDPAPWPALQRYDFLVRTRPLTAAELKDAQRRQQARPPSYLAPQHRAILSALRGLAELEGKAQRKAE